MFTVDCSWSGSGETFPLVKERPHSATLGSMWVEISLNPFIVVLNKLEFMFIN